MKKPSRQEKLAHLDEALKHIRSSRLAVDAGAHVGNWTKVMAGRFDRVIAFEPLVINQERWRERMAGIANVKMYPVALGDRNCRGDMVGKGHSKHYFVSGFGAVEMTKLDELGLVDLDFLKVDCEGADALVLRGAIDTLKRCRPVVIVESYPRIEARYDLPAGAPLKFLESLGARCVGEMWRDFIFVFPT